MTTKAVAGAGRLKLLLLLLLLLLAPAVVTDLDTSVAIVSKDTCSYYSSVTACQHIQEITYTYG